MRYNSKKKNWIKKTKSPFQFCDILYPRGIRGDSLLFSPWGGEELRGERSAWNILSWVPMARCQIWIFIQSLIHLLILFRTLMKSSLHWLILHLFCLFSYSEVYYVVLKLSVYDAIVGQKGKRRTRFVNVGVKYKGTLC